MPAAATGRKAGLLSSQNGTAMDLLQLLGMVLDLTDTVIGTVAIVSLWYAWGVPAKQDPRPTSRRVSGRTEIDRFLRNARSCAGAGAEHVHEEDKEPVKPALPWPAER